MEELKMIYGMRQACDECLHHRRSGQDLKNSYTLTGLYSSQIPAGRTGSVAIDGLGESIDYTIDRANGKAILRMSHSFEEIDSMLEQVQ